MAMKQHCHDIENMVKYSERDTENPKGWYARKDER